MGTSQSYTLVGIYHSLHKPQTRVHTITNLTSLSDGQSVWCTRAPRKKNSRCHRKMYATIRSASKEEVLRKSVTQSCGMNGSLTSELKGLVNNQQGSSNLTDKDYKGRNKSDQPMDDYIEPKDSKFQWGILKSPLSTHHYSDDEDDDDDDRYSQPYNRVPGPGQPMWKNSTSPAREPDDVYEISPGPPRKTNSNYDVPPPHHRSVAGPDCCAPRTYKPMVSSKGTFPLPEADDYCHLRHNGGTTQTAAAGGVRSVSADSNDHNDTEDSYNHTTSWLAQKTERQNSNASNPPPTPSRTEPGIPTTMKNASCQNSNSSLSGTSPVFRNSTSKSAPQETSKTFSRQRVIYPRKSSSSSVGGMMTESEGGSHRNSGPVIYEEAWDTAQQQKKLAENLRLARSISSCSDTFEDALEYLPEDWAPARQRNNHRKTDSSLPAGKTTDPVSGGEYEPAWDLNRGLEEKLRSLQVPHGSSEPGRGGGGGGGDSNYQEPWDLAQKQRELEERIQMARAGGVRGGNARSAQHLHHHHQQYGSGGQQSGGGELYETPWDTKKGLAHMLQSPHSMEGLRSSLGSGGSPLSTRSCQSVFGTVGEPINAMIPLNNQEWYHGNISRDDAERMLRVCKDGSYLVRDSSDRFHYTLSIKSAVQTIHIQIDQCQKADGSMRYILGKNSKAFPTIPSMIDHYTHNVVPIRGAEHMMLLYPVHCKYSGGDELSA